MEERVERIDNALTTRIETIREMHRRAVAVSVDERVRKILSGVNVDENAFPTRRDKSLMVSILHIEAGGSDSLPTKCLRCGGVSSRILSVLAGFSCCCPCGSKFMGLVGAAPEDENFDPRPLIFSDSEVQSTE